MERHMVRITFEDERVAWVVVENGPNPEITIRGLRNVVAVDYEHTTLPDEES